MDSRADADSGPPGAVCSPPTARPWLPAGQWGTDAELL